MILSRPFGEWVIRLKNNYSRLKRSIIARTLLISILSVAVGYGILTFLVDGIFHDSFANLTVRIFMKFGMSEWRAIECYNDIFIYNKTLFVVGGFCILFLFSFYVSVGRLTRYLNSISDALEKTLDASDEPILLPPELEPIADTLSTLKLKLKRREKQAAGK